jgi:Mg-chelatase subunit ChlD
LPAEPAPGPDPTLERWRLVLGEAGGGLLGAHAGQGGPAAGQGQRPGSGGLSAEGLARDAALDWLYQRDDDLDRRGVRRSAGSGPSALTTADWLDDIHRLFPKETIERLERDAVERYGINEIVTDPGVLSRVEPNPTLLRAVLRTKHLMNPQVLELARKLVAEVVRQLMEKVRADVRQAFSGSRSRRPTLLRRASSFDIHRTIRDNLEHYDPQQRRIYVETPHFRAREKRHLDRWQVILVVDQSGSMVGSVIHSAVTAACLWGLPGVKAHLIAFDTSVVDLTSDVDDPVELLMKVQLGGGTDIARAVEYAAGLIEQPRRTILAVVSDFYEGGDPYRLVRNVRGLVEQGTHVLGLAALDEEANPQYDRELAQKLADAGAHVGAMTPGELASFVAERIGR